MGLFDFARKVARAQMLQVKNDVTWDGDRGWTLVSGKDGEDLPNDYEAYVREGWRRNPVVRRCVQENQTSVSEAPIRAFREDADGNLERVAGHPVEEMFLRPNPRDSGVDFIERATQHFLIGGNVHIEKRRLGSGIPFELYPIGPERVVSVDVDSRGIPVSWEVVADVNTGRTRTVPAEDMIHIPDTDPLNEVFGMPRLVSAILETDTDNKASDYVNEILRNHGTPGTIVSVDADKVRQGDMIARAESRWTEKFGPGRGRGKVAFLPGAQKVQNIGFNLKDLDFKGLRHVTREGLATVFGVPPILIGIATGSKGSSLSGSEFQEARRSFWEQTIIPMLRRWEASLNAFLAPEFGDVVLRFDLSEVTALQPDRDADVERAVKMAEAGTFTDEEIRAEVGADPELSDDAIVVVKGTGLSFVRAGDRIVEDDGEEEPVVPDEDEDPEEEDEESRLAADLADALDDWQQKAAPVVPATRFTAIGHSVPTRDDGPEAWKQFDEFARAQEPVYRLAAEEMYRIQADEIRRLALAVFEEKSAGPDETKAITPESLDEFRRRLGEKFSQYHRDWRRRYDVLMSQTVDVVAAGLSGATGMSFDVFNPLVREAIEERLNLIVDADRLTFDAVMKIAEDGFVEGLSREEMARRVSGVVTDGVTVRLPSGKTRVLAGAERARLIATTETTAISNKAAVSLLRTTGIPWVKMWLTQGDDKVRPAHQEEEADSEADPVPMDEPFRVTGLDAPGEPNCRCSVLAEQA